MTYTKIGGRVGFREKDHTYTHLDTGDRYTSVTTLIAKFRPKFNGEYWSLYKAIKDILEKKGKWYELKRAAGGWENAVDYFEKYHIGFTTLESRKAIAERQQWYLEKWENEGKIANEKGSKIHEDLENAFYHSKVIREGHINYEVSQESILEIQDFTSNKSYPELLIYNDEYKISGQIDNCNKEGRHLDLGDYKTYKKLDMEGFRGEMLLKPLSHIPNANYWTTALQLSMYGWMLEELGYIVRSLTMYWIHGKDALDTKREAGVKSYTMPYLKEDVIRMLNYK